MTSTRQPASIPVWLVPIAMALAWNCDSGCLFAAESAPRWNLLLIFTDDQTHRTVSAYEESYPWLSTPHIDRLATEGVRFEHAYCGSWCSPSRAMIMSGRQLHELEKPERLRGDSGVAPIWLSSLRGAGYRTCFIGKWDLPPTLVGPWDRSVVWNRSVAWNRDPARYYHDEALEIDGDEPRVVEGYSTDVYTRFAVEFIEREHDRPWLMWLCYGAPHVPCVPPERHRDLYADAKVALPTEHDMFGPRDNVPRYQRRRSTVVRKDGRIERLFPEGVQMTELIRRCAATVRGVDDGVGQILEALRRNGQLDHTLIVFTSDDGMPFGEHGFTNKIGPYDACQRVPMIVRGPPPVARGRVCRHPVGALDLIPAFFAVAGVEPPYPLHGHDLSVLLRDPDADWPHPVLLEFFGFHAGAATHRSRTVEEGRFNTNSTSPTAIPWWLFLRQGRYKYIRTLMVNEIEELYDIEADPGEHRNLAVDSRHRDLVREFRAKLASELRHTGGESLADNLPAPVETGGSVGMVISTTGSARATTGVGNKIVTFDGKSHVVWQDATADGYVNRVRTYDHNRRVWSEPVTLEKGPYTHRTRPVITVDHRGFLHVLMNGHDSPITYRRSVRPNDASQWTDGEPAGEGIYPSVVCGSDDTLFVSAQLHTTGDAVLLVRPNGENWEQIRLVERGDDYAGTFAACLPGLAIGSDDTLHFLCNLQRGKGGVPGLHQAVCYMRSRDAGRTWEKADGTPVALPARPERMDVLAEATPPPRELKRGMRSEFAELVANGNIVVDSDGTPYALYLSHAERPGQLILATPDKKGKWTRRTIHVADRQHPAMRPIGICLPLTMAEDDAIYALVELVPLGPGWVEGKPQRRMVLRSEPVKRLVLLVSTDRGETFTASTLIPPGTMFHMASIERQTGPNTIPAGRVPPWVYFDGRCDYPVKNQVRNNKVFWVRPSE